MEGITFLDKNINPRIESNLEYYGVSFYKDKYFFIPLENYVNFIKGCEKLIRKTKEYKTYKHELMTTYGLNKCQVFGNIEADDGITIEMHHGPILTLFDYCAIVTDYLLNTEQKVNTFIVSNIILEEHFNDNVQTIMLCETAHQAIDTNMLFLLFKNAKGNLNNFLKKYREGLNDFQISKINEFIELCSKYVATDNGLFELNKVVEKYSLKI